MSLDEIESRIGSIIPTDTLSLLKSGVWKERLEGADLVKFLISLFILFIYNKLRNNFILLLAAMGMLKQSVESLGDLDQSAELLIRLLCAIPGWTEKNVQVQQQVIEVVTYIASTVRRFHKRCVVLCLLGKPEIF